MPRATRFPSGLQTGRDVGIPSQNTLANVVQMQECTVEFGALKNQFQFPPNSYPTEMTVLVTVPVSGSGMTNGVNVRFGISADATRYGTVPVSAAGNVRMTAVSGAAWAGGFGTADYNIVAIDATAQGSAADLEEFKGLARISYIIKDA